MHVAMFKSQRPDPAGAEELQRPPANYPTLDAFVSAAESDPDGVRTALASWVSEAPAGDRQIERQAQFHYWLFRAGENSELEKLRALATAYPKLTEVGVYLRLAVQDLDELWS